MLREEARGDAAGAEALGTAVAEGLLAKGAGDILREVYAGAG